MARFEVRIDTPRPADEAWNRVLDLGLHDRLVPFTRITSGKVPATELRTRAAFVARTGLGPLGFDDPMVVEELVRPSAGSAGYARIRKQGKVIQGSIVVRVSPAARGSRVEWEQEISVWGVPRALGWLTARAGRAAYGMALRRLLAFH